MTFWNQPRIMVVYGSLPVITTQPYSLVANMCNKFLETKNSYNYLDTFYFSSFGFMSFLSQTPKLCDKVDY